MMSTAGDHEASVAVPGDQFAQLMAAIQASQQQFDNKFAEFQAEVRQGQEDAASKVRHERPYNFKEQAGFNEKLEDVVTEAPAHLSGDGSPPAIERAQEALTKGMKLFAERQKLIKIADRSEFGWGVVAEYTADELAEDSNDEKAWRRQRKQRRERLQGGRRSELSLLRKLVKGGTMRSNPVLPARLRFRRP